MNQNNNAGSISQTQDAAQAAAIAGDIEDITIQQSNSVGTRDFGGKKHSGSKKKNRRY
ncbi:hypothetical protein D3C72_2579360 [compost metagenome]